MLDLPPDVPPQYAVVVVAEAKQTQAPAQSEGEKIDRTIGVCHLVLNPNPDGLAFNSLSPVGVVSDYFEEVERNPLGLEGKATVLQNASHGDVEVWPDGEAAYLPKSPNYTGSDTATLLVELRWYKVKLVFFFKVLSQVPGGNDVYDPYDDKKYCPNGRMWLIARNSNKQIKVNYTWTHPSKTYKEYVEDNKECRATTTSEQALEACLMARGWVQSR